MLDQLNRITQRADTHPEEVFNNLFSLLTDELLWHAFRRLKRDKAAGIDGVTVRCGDSTADVCVQLCVRPHLCGTIWSHKHRFELKR